MPDNGTRNQKIFKQKLFTEQVFGIEEIPQTDPWVDVQRQASTCTLCRLSEHRTQVVFGEGNPRADLLFIGEGPGYEEDKQGRPFVGMSNSFPR